MSHLHLSPSAGSFHGPIECVHRAPVRRRPIYLCSHFHLCCNWSINIQQQVSYEKMFVFVHFTLAKDVLVKLT